MFLKNTYTISVNEYKKVYVGMLLHVDCEGKMLPYAIEWEDGRVYRVDRVLRERMKPPINVGAILARRYDIILEGHARVIYLETATNRWFVEKLM